MRIRAISEELMLMVWLDNALAVPYRRLKLLRWRAVHLALCTPMVINQT